MENLPYPEEFLQNMQKLLKDEYPAFLASLQEPSAPALRINPKRTGVEAYLSGKNILRHAVPWELNGRYIQQDFHPGTDPVYFAGGYYMQDASAMAPANVLCVQPGEKVLDLCAAPGGKSGQLAVQLGGKGILISNEPDAKRARILEGNLERLGVCNAAVTIEYPEKLSQHFPDTFDAILVDAPCSGEGMFRKDADTREQWSPERVRGCSERQRGILREAIHMLRPGGRLVYSTCTFNPQENEENIQWVLDTFPEMTAVDFSLEGIGNSQNGTLRLWPHKIRGEGHFVAQLRKRELSETVCEETASAASTGSAVSAGSSTSTGSSASVSFSVYAAANAADPSLVSIPVSSETENDISALPNNNTGSEESNRSDSDRNGNMSDRYRNQRQNHNQNHNQNQNQKQNTNPCRNRNKGNSASTGTSMSKAGIHTSTKNASAGTSARSTRGKLNGKPNEPTEEIHAKKALDILKQEIPGSWWSDYSEWEPRLQGDFLWLIPPGMPDLSGLKSLSCGLRAGELQRKRDIVYPSHTLSMAVSTEKITRVRDLLPEEVSSYMHGEVLPCEEDGWTLVTCMGLALGWGKGTQGILKNHLPKGLRC